MNVLMSVKMEPGVTEVIEHKLCKTIYRYMRDDVRTSVRAATVLRFFFVGVSRKDKVLWVIFG